MASDKREIRGEYRGAEFRDYRLTKRLAQLAEAIADSPEKSFPKGSN